MISLMKQTEQPSCHKNMKTTFIAWISTAFALFAGERSLFDGKTLSGWEGMEGMWSVEDGAITGKTSKEKPLAGNTFLVWKGGEVGDFELTLQYKFSGSGKDPYGNSGIQYRSKLVDPKAFVISGYQGDFEVGTKWSGILYEEKGRGVLAKRGEKVIVHQGEKAGAPRIELVGETNKSEEIQAVIKPLEWNTYRIVAKGNHLQHYINGKLSVDITDNTKEGAKTGLLALQLHQGPPMQVQFKDIVLID
jgi:hypothetical protein